MFGNLKHTDKTGSLTENRFNNIASSAMFQVHERCFSPSLSEFNSLASARMHGFSEKKRLNARGFAWEFLRSSTFYRPRKSLKRRGKSSSLHSKKNFLLGG